MNESAIKPGDVFGGLTVLEKAEPRKGNTYWKCRCVCGNIVEKFHGNLKSGRNTSCGCRRQHTKEAWQALIKKNAPQTSTSTSKKAKKNSAEENLIQVKLASEDFVRLVDADAPVWLVWVKEILGYPDHVDYDTLATYRAPHLAELDAVVSLIRRTDPNMSSLGQRAQTLILTSEGPLPRDWWKETLSEHARRIGEHWNKYADK